MSATTTYRLPTADDFAWVEDLISTVESRLDEIHSDLKRPFDGNPDTQAEPATLAYVGRTFLFARVLRFYAEGFIDRAEGIEKAVDELRAIQEEDDDLLPDKESYTAYAQRYARQWAEGAESAAETLASAMAREGGESDG